MPDLPARAFFPLLAAPDLIKISANMGHPSDVPTLSSASVLWSLGIVMAVGVDGFSFFVAFGSSS